MHLDKCRLFLSTLFAYVIHITDGCGRTPARTKPTPTTVDPASGSTGSAYTTPRPSHLFLCTPDDVRNAACLNGGECRVVVLVHRHAACRCPEMWTGSRCERLDSSFFSRVLNADKVTKAGIAAGVVVLVIILTVTIVYLVIKRRKNRRKRNGQVIATNGVHKQLTDKEGNLLEFPPECGVYPDKSETNV